MSNCIRCRKEKKWTDFNYARYDLDLSKDKFPFPERLKTTFLPGEKWEFLCGRCAGKVPVMCSVHGNINHQDFQYGNQPRCGGCDYQLKQIKADQLPSRFEWSIPASRIAAGVMAYGTGWVALSDDGYLHFITQNDDVVLSELIRDLTFNCVTVNNRLVLRITDISDKNETQEISGFQEGVVQCDIDISNGFKLNKAAKDTIYQWMKRWVDSINSKLSVVGIGLEKICLANVKRSKLTDTIGSEDCSHFTSLVYFDGSSIRTYPNCNFPELKFLKKWQKQYDKGLRLMFEVDNRSQVLEIAETDILQATNFVQEVCSVLPENLQSSDYSIFDLKDKALNQVHIFPRGECYKAHIEIGREYLLAKFLDGFDEVQAKYGFCYADYLLGVVDHKNVITYKMSTGEQSRLINHMIQPSEIFTVKENENGEDEFFAPLLDLNKQPVAHIFRCSAEKCCVDDLTFKHDVDFKLELEELDGHSGFLKLLFVFPDEIECKELHCVAPKDLCHSIYETWDAFRSTFNARSRSIPDLYTEYNGFKKSNLLFGLFSELFVFNRELTKDRSLEEIYQSVVGLSASDFFSRKSLLYTVTEKVLQVSTSLQKLKERMEYMSLYYPYFIVDKEAKWLNDIFGNEVAIRIITSERDKIVSAYRSKVKNVQSEIRVTFGEVERAIAPAIRKFNHDDIKNTNGNSLLKYGTMAAAAAATGGVSMLFQLPTLAKDVSSFFTDNDDGTAATLKEAFEKMYPWYQLLQEVLAVAAFETNQFIEIECNRCMERDKALLSAVPPDEKEMYIQNLQKQLQKRITEEKHSGRIEIVKENGLTKAAIVEDIQFAMKQKMSIAVEQFISRLGTPIL